VGSQSKGHCDCSCVKEVEASKDGVDESLWIAAPVQGTGYQVPQVKEQVPPVRRTGHQSQVKEQVTDFIIPLS